MIIATLIDDPRKSCKAAYCRRLLDSTSTIGRKGSVSITSAKRISTVSVMPPKAPAAAPTSVPSTVVNTVTTRATPSEIRPAYNSREKRSRPSLSVPRMWGAFPSTPGAKSGAYELVRLISS